MVHLSRHQVTVITNCDTTFETKPTSQFIFFHDPIQFKQDRRFLSPYLVDFCAFSILHHSQVLKFLGRCVLALTQISAHLFHTWNFSYSAFLKRVRGFLPSLWFWHSQARYTRWPPSFSKGVSFLHSSYPKFLSFFSPQGPFTR